MRTISAAVPAAMTFQPLLMILLPVAGYLSVTMGDRPHRLHPTSYKGLRRSGRPIAALRLNYLGIRAHVVGEPSAQRESGSMHARFDRVDCHMECLGDLGVGKPFDIAQDQGRRGSSSAARRWRCSGWSAARTGAQGLPASATSRPQAPRAGRPDRMVARDFPTTAPSPCSACREASDRPRWR